MSNDNRGYARSTSKPLAHCQTTYEEWLELVHAQVDDLKTADPQRHIASICPRCLTIQSVYTYQLLTNLGRLSIMAAYGVECIGRNAEGVGCDWHLGGLLKIHEATVIRDGREWPLFRLATRAEAEALLAHNQATAELLNEAVMYGVNKSRLDE